MYGRTARDADLVARAKRGDADAFEQLVLRHRTRLYELARQLVSERDAAQDVVQEALLRAYRALPSLQEAERFGPWVNTIVRRLGQQWLRTGHRRPEPLDGEAVRGLPRLVWGAEPDPPSDLVTRVRAALAVLTERERRVMVLHYLEGLSCEEIAQRLHLTNASVRRLLHYSRRKVRTEAELMKHAETMKPGPRRLTTWIHGDMGGAQGRTTIFDYLAWGLAQTICLAVNKQAKTAPQIAEQVAADGSYVAEMADHLLELEALVSPKPGHYLANFIAFESEDWRRLTSLARQPAGAAAQRLAAAASRLCAAFEKTPLAASGWTWQQVIWPVYALVVCNLGFVRNLPPEHRPAWPARPDGGRYWLGGHEETPDLPPLWMTGLNGSTLAGGLSCGWFWSPGFRREYPPYLHPGDARAVVLNALAAGPRTEAELLAQLGDDPERWRGALATAVQQALVARGNGAYRLTFPVFRRGDSDLLLGEVEEVIKPIVDGIAEPAFADLEEQLDAMGYGHLRAQYPQWHTWLSGGVMGEALHFLLEQGVLPRPPDPAPRNFCLVAWEQDLPLMAWKFGT